MATATKNTKAAELASRFPRKVELRGGQSVELRLMGAGDRDRMVAFARGLPEDDLLFLRSNITDPAAVDGWIANIADGRTISVVATDSDQIVGYATVHLSQAEWMRHLGEIRLLTGDRYRGAGLGRALASEIFTVASAIGLRKLSAQMTLDQPGARATFERLGFKPEALLTDWVISKDGRTRDLLIMAHDVDGLTDTV